MQRLGLVDRMGLGRLPVRHRGLHIVQSLIQEVNQCVDSRGLPFAGDDETFAAALFQVGDQGSEPNALSFWQWSFRFDLDSKLARQVVSEVFDS